jgi:outer membrane lipopolysaccharide assembly protein LptE/RlpB
LDFHLQSSDGKKISNSRHVEIFRDYSFDEQEILAATREEEFLRRDMEAAMVSEVLRRLEELPIRSAAQS